MNKVKDKSGLDRDLQDALHLSNDERIQRVLSLRSEAWIPYPRAQTILHQLDDLYNLPRPRLDISRSFRSPNLMVISDTNNGKSHLINHFYSLHSKDNNLEGDAIYAPVISIEVDSPSLADFYSLILMFINASFRHRDAVGSKKFQILKLLRHVGTRMLIIDELNTAVAGTSLKQRIFWNAIKNLNNCAHISIVGAGTKEVFSALRLVPQLDNRFERAELKRWEFGDEFRRLLASFECLLPLRHASELQEPSVAMRLYSMTEGYIGEVANLLIKAAICAIETGSEKIDQRLLAKIEWKSPTERIRTL